MSTLAAIEVSRPEAAPNHLSRPALGIIAALFCGYLCVGLPLPVIPLFIHDQLGFSNPIVGLVIGIQFLATVLTRGYAGRLTDQHSGKRSALQGAAVCALSGLFYLVAAMPGLPRAISLATIIAGRLTAGFGESQFVTGCVSWSIASVGPQRAGTSMSWTGIAMFAALAIGAPIGMALYQAYGLQAAMVACIVVPLVALAIACREAPYTSPPGRRLPFYRVIGQIWREGLGLMRFLAQPSLYRPAPPNPELRPFPATQRPNTGESHMSRIFISGSSTGLGLMAGELLIKQGHQVVLHARNTGRAEDARHALPEAEAIVEGNLDTVAGAKEVAARVNELGHFDAVIHNAAVGYRERHHLTADGLPHVFAINTLATYILTAMVARPHRLVYLSSGMHHHADANLDDILWRKRRWDGSTAYAESKLHDAMLAFAVARRWPDVLSNSLEPGWVPTRMGGPGAPDDMDQAHLTQAWLAVGNEPQAQVTGGYFYHLRPLTSNPQAMNAALQDRLIEICAELSGVALPRSPSSAGPTYNSQTTY